MKRPGEDQLSMEELVADLEAYKLLASEMLAAILAEQVSPNKIDTWKELLPDAGEK